MKIESLLRITGGVLLNTPSINQIDDIKILPSRVLPKNLFIDINGSKEDRDEAILNGAYCILTSTHPDISDQEIAWLHVDNLEMSIIKLSRFYALDKNYKFILLNEIQYKLAKHLNTKIQTLSSKLSLALMQIINSKQDNIFFVIDNKFINKIDPVIAMRKDKYYPHKIFKKGIFSSSFIFNDKYFNDIKLSPLFIPQLCSLLHNLDELQIIYDVSNFKEFEHFYPQFVDNNLNKKEFGLSQRALIFENEFELFLKEVNYLEENVDIKDILLLMPKDTIETFTCKAEKLVYNASSETKKLKIKKFKYALIYGNIEEFEEFIQTTNSTQMTLF